MQYACQGSRVTHDPYIHVTVPIIDHHFVSFTFRFTHDESKRTFITIYSPMSGLTRHYISFQSILRRIYLGKITLTRPRDPRYISLPYCSCVYVYTVVYFSHNSVGVSTTFKMVCVKSRKGKEENTPIIEPSVTITYDRNTSDVDLTKNTN